MKPPISMDSHEKQVPIVIERDQVRIGDRALHYYSYYWSIWDERVDHRITLRLGLIRWADAMDHREVDSNPVYMPLDLDDEGCDFLQAARRGDRVNLAVVSVAMGGHSIDLSATSDVFSVEPPVCGEALDIGEFDAASLIDGLRRARLRPPWFIPRLALNEWQTSMAVAAIALLLLCLVLAILVWPGWPSP